VRVCVCVGEDGALCRRWYDSIRDMLAVLRLEEPSEVAAREREAVRWRFPWQSVYRQNSLPVSSVYRRPVLQGVL
jgi:hypothetical protein